MQRGLTSPLKQTSCPFSDQPPHCLPPTPLCKKMLSHQYFCKSLTGTAVVDCLWTNFGCIGYSFTWIRCFVTVILSLILFFWFPILLSSHDFLYLICCNVKKHCFYLFWCLAESYWRHLLQQAKIILSAFANKTFLSNPLCMYSWLTGSLLW